MIDARPAAVRECPFAVSTGTTVCPQHVLLCSRVSKALWGMHWGATSDNHTPFASAILAKGSEPWPTAKAILAEMYHHEAAFPARPVWVAPCLSTRCACAHRPWPTRTRATAKPAPKANAHIAPQRRLKNTRRHRGGNANGFGHTKLPTNHPLCKVGAFDEYLFIGFRPACAFESATLGGRPPGSTIHAMVLWGRIGHT